jgi:hypothetical protein
MNLISWFSFIRVSGVSRERVSCWVHVCTVVKLNQMNNCYAIFLNMKLKHSALYALHINVLDEIWKRETEQMHRVASVLARTSFCFFAHSYANLTQLWIILQVPNLPEWRCICIRLRIFFRNMANGRKYFVTTELYSWQLCSENCCIHNCVNYIFIHFNIIRLLFRILQIVLQDGYVLIQSDCEKGQNWKTTLHAYSFVRELGAYNANARSYGHRPKDNSAIGLQP